MRWFGEWLEAEGVSNGVTAIGSEHVAAFVAAMEAQRRRHGGARRAGSLNALRPAVRGFIGYLERAGIVERSPGRALRTARLAPTPPSA